MNIGTPRGYVVGVYKHAKGWQTVYVEDGKKRWKTHSGKHAEKNATDWAARKLLELTGVTTLDTQAVAPTDDNSGSDGSLWVRKLWTLVGDACDNPGDSDRRSLLRAVSGAANAAAKFIDDAEVRAQLDHLDREVKRIKAGRAAGQGDIAGTHQTGAAVTDPSLLQ